MHFHQQWVRVLLLNILASTCTLRNFNFFFISAILMWKCRNISFWFPIKWFYFLRLNNSSLYVYITFSLCINLLTDYTNGFTYFSLHFLSFWFTFWGIASRYKHIFFEKWPLYQNAISFFITDNLPCSEDCFFWNYYTYSSFLLINVLAWYVFHFPFQMVFIIAWYPTIL